MINKIIERSIEELQKNGLRFSLDDVAKSLKISKKTIYKYFAAKEELAIAIYKTFYENALQKIAAADKLKLKEYSVLILKVYYQSHCLNRGEIFNKYALNTGIRSLAQKNHLSLRKFVEDLIPESEKKAAMVIIDGALEKLCDVSGEELNVIKRLAEMIC